MIAVSPEINPIAQTKLSNVRFIYFETLLTKGTKIYASKNPAEKEKHISENI